MDKEQAIKTLNSTESPEQLSKLWKEQPDMMNRWVEALRDEKYKQGNGTLYNERDHEYCCLGVLSSVCGIANSDMGGYAFVYSLARDMPLPDTLKAVPQSLQLDLATVNDSRGESGKQPSFEEIADILSAFNPNS